VPKFGWGKYSHRHDRDILLRCSVGFSWYLFKHKYSLIHKVTTKGKNNKLSQKLVFSKIATKTKTFKMKISTSLTENYEYALVTSQNMDDADLDRNISSSERETLSKHSIGTVSCHTSNNRGTGTLHFTTAETSSHILIQIIHETHSSFTNHDHHQNVHSIQCHTTEITLPNGVSTSFSVLFSNRPGSPIPLPPIIPI